ncbi:hypothetical protein pb186bvf_017811 [Paramecium bursaria]
MFQQGNDFEDSDYSYKPKDIPVSFENGAIMFEQPEFIRQHVRDLIVKYDIKNFEEFDFQQIIQHFTSDRYKTELRYDEPKYDYNDIHNFLLNYIRQDKQNQKDYVRIMMEIWRNQAQIYDLEQKLLKEWAKKYYKDHKDKNKQECVAISEKNLQEYFQKKLTSEQREKFEVVLNKQQE